MAVKMVIILVDPCRVKSVCQKQCVIKINGQIIEEVNDFKYFGFILCKHGSMEKETRESFTRKESVRII